MIIKVCGLREPENIREVTALGIDWIGFVFQQQSPRYVKMIPSGSGIMPDRPMLSSLKVKQTPKKVGVFIDPMAQDVITRVYTFNLDIVQLNGKETPTLLRNLRRTLDNNVKLMKTISVGCSADIAIYKDYADCADYFLFNVMPSAGADAMLRPDWSVLKTYDGEVPFLLGGEMTQDDIPALCSISSYARCMGLDLGNAFELAAGVKDLPLLSRFVEQLRACSV